MKKTRKFLLCLIFFTLFFFTDPVSAQNYEFTVTAYEVEAYIEDDGSLSTFYIIEFQNNPNALPIDFVDIGTPNSTYNINEIEARIGDTLITNIESSDYIDVGIALGLGDQAIPPGESGTVTVWIPGIENILFPYEEGDRDNYVSFRFSPNWFDPSADKTTATDYRMTIILPNGVGDDQGVYYNPENWPGANEPDDIGRTNIEDNEYYSDRVYYSWFSDIANTHTQYAFGAAFPAENVPQGAVASKPQEEFTPPPATRGPGFIGSIFNFFGEYFGCCMGIFVFGIFGWSIYQGTVGQKKRKMEYLPPKMKIEGHGIKRGLTAVEAAILMEQPIDKVLTMILFGTLKKEAATVKQQEPLQLEVPEPLPENLHPYEVAFLEAFQEPENKRREAIQKTMVDLVNGVSKKMKGFSRKETVAYYEDIMRRAWKMVEEAETPEVKSEKYDQTLEWTMLDKEYEDRTRRTFTGGPVFVPMWWPRYSPSYRRSIGGGLSTAGKGTATAGKVGGGGNVSLPRIPGSDFAAGVINGATGMAAGVVGNLTSFTSGITNRTNPIPQSSGKSGSGGFRGGGGSSCACACACAGCACACAGGGR
jgi:hypothetical protein